MKKVLKTVALSAAIAATTSTVTLTTAQAAEYTLRFASFFPPVAAPHKEVFVAWAEKVKADSNGRIEVELYPSSTLAKPPALYDAAANGVADVVATVQGYTANRFPLTQIVELPGIVTDAQQGSCVIQKAYDEGLTASEYEETRPLFMFTHGQGHIHTKDKLIEKPSDLAGLRIRRPTAVVAKILEEVEAQPVGMPAPESYQSMQRGVIDGVSLPWEGMKSFRLNELSEKHTEIGLYSLSFVVAMNKRTYNSLPDDLKQVIDANSGMLWADAAGKVFDAQDAAGRKDAVAADHEILTIEGGVENEAWKPVVAAATENYLQELEDKGLPAREVYARTLELAKSCQ